MTPTAPQPAPLPSSAAAERTCPACTLGGDRRHEPWCRVEAVVLLAIAEETGDIMALDAPLDAIGDSLALIVVVFAIEEALGIDDIPDEELRACVTVGDLARAAERAMARRRT